MPLDNPYNPPRPDVVSRLNDNTFFYQFSTPEIFFGRVRAELLQFVKEAHNHADKGRLPINPVDMKHIGITGELATWVIFGGTLEWLSPEQTQRGGDLVFDDGMTAEVKMSRRKGGDFVSVEDIRDLGADYGILLWPIAESTPLLAAAVVGWFTRDDWFYLSERVPHKYGAAGHFRRLRWDLTERPVNWPRGLKTRRFVDRDRYIENTVDIPTEVELWQEQTTNALSTLPKNSQDLRNRSDYLDAGFIAQMREKIARSN